MALRTRNAVLLAEVETTYGTDPTPSASTDAVLVENPRYVYDSVQMIDRPSVRSSLGQLQQLFGRALGAISFDVEMKGSGSAGSAPEMAPLFKACGMTETVVASTSVTYAFSSTSTDFKSLTLYLYEDGTLTKLHGAIPMSVSFAGEAGGVGKWSFTMVGKLGGRTDAAIVTPTYDATVPPIMKGGTFTVQSYAAVTSKLALDFGLTLGKPNSITDSTGYGQLQITARNPTGSISTLDTLIATHDWRTKFQTGTTGTLSTGTIGSTAGNRWSIGVGELFYQAPTQGDQDGLVSLEVPFGITDQTTANNELSIAFT